MWPVHVVDVDFGLGQAQGVIDADVGDSQPRPRWRFALPERRPAMLCPMLASLPSFSLKDTPISQRKMAMSTSWVASFEISANRTLLAIFLSAKRETMP